MDQKAEKPGASCPKARPIYNATGITISIRRTERNLENAIALPAASEDRIRYTSMDTASKAATKMIVKT